MTTGELLNDESWLDLTGKGGPLFKGRFQLLGVVGLSVSRISGLRGPHRSVPGDWPPARATACSSPRPVATSPAPSRPQLGLGRPALLSRYLLGVAGRPWRSGPRLPGPTLGLEGLPGGTALEGPR